LQALLSWRGRIRYDHMGLWRTPIKILRCRVVRGSCASAMYGSQHTRESYVLCE